MVHADITAFGGGYYGNHLVDKFCDSKSLSLLQLKSSIFYIRIILLGYIVISRQNPVPTTKNLRPIVNCHESSIAGSNNCCDS